MYYKSCKYSIGKKVNQFSQYCKFLSHADKCLVTYSYGFCFEKMILDLRDMIINRKTMNMSNHHCTLYMYINRSSMRE